MKESGYGPLQEDSEEKIKMKMRLSLFLVLLTVLALALAACGGGTQQATPTEAPVESAATEAAPAAT